MLSSILICAEVTGHYKGRMRKEGERGMVVKTYKKWEGDVGPCETHLSLLTGAYQSQPPALHTGWETGQGPYLQRLAGTNSKFIW